ncbi:N-acetylmuramoyl-L-alanine amidase [Roseovarius pacificus]|uniref:N-acetylmuramoyl-L-alanine amidase n=1 Tax=Roseovarius pacificus TaxID=337701 RepID=UPI002A18E7BB|nr:N-acetylmuramoyl-L-alanine amidase [Roseovarius pacificus]
MATEIHEIFVHCTATTPDWMLMRSAAEKVAEIDRWHKARGWAGFGYNELCDRDGSSAKGRPIGAQTAAVVGHNRNAVHLVLVGGRGSDASDAFSDHFTEAQREWLLARLAELKRKYPNATIRGHNEVAAKACPGFNVKDFMRQNPLPTAGAPKQVERKRISLLGIIKAIFGGQS